MANKIKGLLLIKGYSVKNYCEEFGLDYQAIRRKIIGTSKMEVEDLRLFRKNLNLTLEELDQFFLQD